MVFQFLWTATSFPNFDGPNDMGLDARKPIFRVCEQHRRRAACASAQTDQRPFYSLTGRCHIKTYFRQNFNSTASLRSSGDRFESRFFGNPEDWFCRDEAHIFSKVGKSLCLLVDEISCTQKSIKLKPKGSTLNTMCPPLLRSGEIMSQAVLIVT